MPGIKLKILLGLLGAAVLVAGAIAFWPAGRVLRVMAPHDSSARPLFWGARALKEQGINFEVEFIHLNEVEAVRALAGAKADVAILSVVPELFLANPLEGEYVVLDCLYAAEPVEGGGFSWLMGRSPTAAGEAREGRTIALERAQGSLERIFSDRALAQRGVAPGSVRRLVMSPLEARRAFSIGDLDYAVIPEPIASLVEADGSATKLSAREKLVPGVALYVIAARKSFALAEPERLQKFRDVMRKLARNNSQPKGPVDLVKMSTWPNQGLKSCAGAEPSRAALSAAMEFFKQNKLFAGEKPRLPQLF